MSSNKIFVNGSELEKEFFEENVKEAKTYDWIEETELADSDHGHCIVCTISIPDGRSKKFYKSGSILLCHYCYTNFVSQ